MLTDTLLLLFTRDLGRLRREIELYRDEANLWRVDGAVPNSAGHLCLHLLGNLQTYIGRELGGSGYVRDREQEFARRPVPRATLLHGIDATLAVVTTTLRTLPPEALARPYPVLVFEQPSSTEFLLTHLATHLAYHLGQINYHRRLLDQ